MRPTVNELIDAYLNQKIRMPIKLGKIENTCSASGTSDNHTHASIPGDSGTDVSDVPEVPEKPFGFLFLKRPVVWPVMEGFVNQRMLFSS